jgi:transcriptional regulator with XRE-family HTH domain
MGIIARRCNEMTAQVQDDILALMAKRLAEYRAERYLTVDEFSELLGITPRTLYRIMRGETKPRPTTMRRIAEKLGVHPRDITEFAPKDIRGK